MYNISEEKWTFPMLLHWYLENESIFEEEWEDEFDAYPLYVRAELKGFVVVLNAFTGGKYNIKSNRGRKKIREAFILGFGRGNQKCTTEQVNQLRELFPYCPDIYDYWQSEKPTIGALYQMLFATLFLGYRFISLFNDYPKGATTFKIVETFKFEELDKYIYDKDNILIKAILILLGPDFERSFGKTELIKKYGYPKILD